MRKRYETHFLIFKLSKTLTAVLLFWSLFSLLTPHLADAAISIRCEELFSRDLHTIFDAAYFDPDVYVPTKCPFNIARLLNLAAANGVDMAEAKVIIIRDAAMSHIRSDKMSVFGGTELENQEVSGDWNYHVFLIRHGQVFDFDFHIEPFHLETRKYFQSTWLRSHIPILGALLKSRTIQVYSMPPEIFIKAIDDKINWGSADLVAHGAQQTSIYNLIKK